MRLCGRNSKRLFIVSYDLHPYTSAFWRSIMMDRIRMVKTVTIAIIDGQGGRIGVRLVEEIRKALPEAEILAAGANTAATERMLAAGAARGATGENAVRVVCRSADIIAGPVGIAIADSMLGEITPAMALAVAQSRAARVLIPIGKCETIVVGSGEKTMSELLSEAVARITALCQGDCGQ